MIILSAISRVFWLNPYRINKNNHVSLLELESYKTRAVADDKSVLLDFVL
ncbi:hypothetical protein [Helicobacter pylori]|nr:hypothetical protein [Helicobacter pylori]